MKRFGLASSALVAAALLCAVVSSASACVRVPTSIPNSRLLTTDATHLTVPVHAIVWLALVEADEYTRHPGFPWGTPTTSNQTVLAPLHTCKQTGFSSLPDKAYAFEAMRPGKATLTAPLAAGWPGSIKRELQTVRDTVTIR